MILDRVENADLYRSMGANIATALDYLRQTDFAQTPDGRYELDGGDVYAVVRRYRPGPIAEAVWEAHRQYIDVQYVAAGSERMGYAPLCNQLTIQKAYDPEGDYLTCNAKGDFFEIGAGGFAIFGPQDLHAPGVAIDGPEASGEVCKVVVKCRVAESRDS